MAQETSPASRTTAPRPDDDRALVETQNWASRSHPELYASVHQDNDPGRVGELAQEWHRMGVQIQDASKAMSDRMAATEDGWVGEAAESARHAIRELADWSGKAGDTATHVGWRVSQQGQIMETAKANMPEPIETQPQEAHFKAYASGNLYAFTAATVDLKHKHEQAKTAHGQAVTVMEQMETESRTVDGELPKFVPPPDPIRQATQARVLQRNEQAAGGAPGTAGEPPTSGSPSSPNKEGGKPSSDMPGETGNTGLPPSETPGQTGNTPPVPPQHMPSPNPGSMPGGFNAPGATPTGGGPGSTSPLSSEVPAPPPEVPEIDVPPTGGNTPTSFSGGQGGSPDLSDYQPDSTSSQGAGPSLSIPTSNTGGGDDLYRSSRYPSVPDPSTGGLSGQPLTTSGPGKKNRTGWSGSVPNLPSGGSTGGSTSGGLSGGTTAGSGPSAGGRASTGAVPGGGRVPTEGMSTGRTTTGTSGSSGMMGGAPGAAGRGQEQDEKERSNKYMEHEQLFEVPGADLPPPVIGAGKPKKRRDPEGQQNQEGQEGQQGQEGQAQ